MLKLTQTVVVLLLLTTFAAGQQKAIKPTSNASEIPQNTIIKLSRTACFGACPIYTVTIDADGKIIYEGEKFVKKSGRVESHITQEQVKQLVAEIENADYFSLKDKYTDRSDGCPTNWTDSPAAITTIRLGEREKTIVHDYGCTERDKGGESGRVYPHELYELESKIDEIVNTKQWIK